MCLIINRNFMEGHIRKCQLWPPSGKEFGDFETERLLTFHHILLNLFEIVSCSFILFFNNKCTNEKINKKGRKEGREGVYTHGWVILTPKPIPLQLLFHSQKLEDTGLNFSKQSESCTFLTELWEQKQDISPRWY